METLNRIDRWNDSHQYVLLSVLRFALGAVIFYKGFYFVQHTEELQNMMANSKFPWVSLGLVHFVAMAHLVGGILIAIGLITRIACLFQIPILLGAVIFVNSQHGFYTTHTYELWLSLVVLAGLIFFAIYGSGPVSFDKYMKDHPNW